MSARLIIRNLPRNLTQEGLIKVFSDLRGFLNCSLHINAQNDVYGIVEFSSVELADYARKVKSSFKFLGSPYPINIEFFYPQAQQEFYPAPNHAINTSPQNLNPIQSHPNLSNNINQLPPSPGPSQGNFQNFIKTEYQGHSTHNTYQNSIQPHVINEIEAPMSQDMYMQQQYQQHPLIQQQQRFPLENTQNPEIFHAPQSQNFGFQGNPNQLMQHGINIPSNKLPNPSNINLSSTPTSQSSMMGMMPPNSGNMNFSTASMSTNSSINSPSMKNFPNMPLMNPGKGFPTNQAQNINSNPQFHPPLQGNYNPNSLMAKMMNMKNPGNQNFPGGKPSSDDDLELFKVPSKATCSIYVDGIPIDATEREVSHLFRPFPGFKVVRLIKKESKTGRKFYFCFVDFDNSLQSTIALCTLQGYRFDKSDKKGLKISYAFHPQETNRPNQHKSTSQSFR